jgi:sec-independent protein translocase protein TatC
MADEPNPIDSHSERDPQAASPESDHSQSAEPTQHAGYPSSSATDPTSELNQPARYIQPAPSDSSDVTSEEDEEGGPVKSFLEHLEDLRWVLIKIIASVLVAMTICMVATPQIIEILTWPKNRTETGRRVEITYIDPLAPFTSMMKIAFWGGLALAIPYILFVIGQFVMPALKRNEKPYFQKAFIVGGGLFFLGLIICYFLVLPIGIAGMVQMADWMKVRITQWRADEYFQFATMFMLGMGLSFEIPVIILTLVKMGVIPHEWMVKGRMYFFIGNLVVCAFITPDAVSTIFMVVPVQLLLEICIQISAHWERKKRKEEALLRDKDK